MYAQDTGGCGCGSGGTVTARQRYGHIDSQGRCVCGECEPCDGLTCSCRPRFYDGQLLTAATFTKLDQYVVAKNRLHNRYLHGVGVVCGLEAVCSPCDDTVTVRPGYALGPCGDDIVVCGDATVDVAALIRAQRTAGTRSDCAPYSEPVPQSEAVRQKWILGICYDERQSRPMTTLKRSGSSGCGCGGSCGGSGGGSGGCGCGGSGATSASTSSTGSSGCGCGGSCGTRTTTPATCEPTEICEGYRFTLTKVQPNSLRSAGDVAVAKAYGAATTDDGSLPAVVRACLARLRAALTQVPSNPTPGQVIAYAAQLKSDLRDLIDGGNVHDCTLGQRLSSIVIPSANDQNGEALAQQAVTEMLQIVIDLFRDCICSALLPPCGVSCADDCVPLAVVTVRTSDLQVLEICNWSARQFVITMPALSYWLGWLPIFGVLRSSLERLCCGQVERPGFAMSERLKVRTVDTQPQAAMYTAPAAAGAAAEAAKPESPFATLAGQYASTWTSLSGLEATVLGAIGARSTRNRPMASETELDNPLAALALGRLGVEAGQALLPEELAQRFVAGVAPQTSAQETRLADLEDSLGKLRRKVDTQARTIRDLRAKGPDQ